MGSCGGLLGGAPMVLDGPPLPAPPRTAWAAGVHPPPRSPHPSVPAHRRPTPPGSKVPKPQPSKAVASVGRIQRAIVAGEGTGRAKTALPDVCAQFSTFHGFAAAPPEQEAAGRETHATAKPKRVRPASASASLRLGRTRIRDQQQSEEVFDGPYAADPRPISAGGQRSSGGKHRILTVRGRPGSAEGRSREDDASEIQKLRGQVAELVNPYPGTINLKPQTLNPKP